MPRDSFDVGYFLLGIVVAVICLSIWGSLSFTVYSFSLLSPNGPRVLLFGFRLKHWMIGLTLLMLSPLISLKSDKAASFVMGFGLILILDEIPEFFLLMSVEA